MPYLQNQIRYMHQTFFSQPKHTIIKAINNNQFKGFPFMKLDLIRKNLANAPATSKGRRRRPRKGLRSTQTKAMRNMQQTQTNNAPTIIPLEEDSGDQHEVMNNIFFLPTWQTSKPAPCIPMRLERSQRSV